MELAVEVAVQVERARRALQTEELDALARPAREHAKGLACAPGALLSDRRPRLAGDQVQHATGDGVFDRSIRALQLLNSVGYGRTPDLALDLVYNPNGDFLPSDQAALEVDYRRELKQHFDIDFHRLYTITNMPIGRFASWLRHNGKLGAYMELLVEAFNPASVAGLMCRNTLSVGWRGEVYDCDFNQQLGMQWKEEKPLYLWDLDPEQLNARPIGVGNHCFGCTAGAGSSCGGALVS